MATQPITFDFEAAIHGVPHDKKWEVLKPELEVLFHSHESYATIAQHMKTKYGFDAQISAYKYRFRKWGWKRSVPAHKKDDILTHTQQRALQGKRTAPVSFGTTIVDSKKLKRHVASTKNITLTFSNYNHEFNRQIDGFKVHLAFGARPFAMWAAPFGGGTRPLEQSTSSPFTNIRPIDTPSELDFHTPSDSHSSIVASPANAPSPLAAVASAHALSNRAKLFTQGKLMELIRTMDSNQQRTMSSWLYQFWLFAFKSAKDWGPGFRPWNAGNMNFAEYQQTQSPRVTGTPNANVSSPTARAIETISGSILAPSDLCRWSIHLKDDAMYPRVGNNASTEGHGNEPHEWPQQSLDQHLYDRLRDNGFSTIPAEQIPVNLNLITEAAANSPLVLFEEALSFVIIAQNYEAFLEMFDDDSPEKMEHALKEINAMHIATSYLNGGGACCTILALICETLEPNFVKDAYVNDYGHTVLDNLMLNILKCHSTAGIEHVDDSLGRGTRYTGIEVDICGRWDADSPCFRSLVATGATSIPRLWKHKFCNTSIQVICHCMLVLDQWSYPMYHASGLFQKLCTHCGMKLQLKPLHSLIVISYVLANNACIGEDLFGIVACFLCMLFCGCDPLDAANISVTALIGTEGEPNQCNHRLMTPHDLVEELSNIAFESWSTELKTGWTVLSNICERAEDGHSAAVDDEDFEQTDAVFREHFELDCGPYCCTERKPDYRIAFGNDLMLGHLWAAIQAELLNHRRLNENDSWLSENFDMTDLVERFEHDVIPKVGYSRENMLAKYCVCGRFECQVIAQREDVSKKDLYFANMDCWKRTSFIHLPEFPMRW